MKILLRSPRPRSASLSIRAVEGARQRGEGTTPFAAPSEHLCAYESALMRQSLLRRERIVRFEKRRRARMFPFPQFIGRIRSANTAAS